MVFVLIFIGCSRLGTKVNFYQTDIILKINKIAIAPVIIINPEYQEMINFATECLKNEVGRYKDFDFIFPDSLMSFCEENEIEIYDTKKMTKLAMRANADAIIFCNIQYFYKAFESDKNAFAIINIIDTNNGNTIALAEYDTFKGNSYFLPPSREKSTRDAIHGATKGIFKRWSLLLQD